jgi:hypothetical protein
MRRRDLLAGLAALVASPANESRALGIARLLTPPPQAPYRRQSGVALPTPYSDNIKFAQVFDRNTSPKTLLSGTREIVWGNVAPLGYVLSSAYITFQRDDEASGGLPVRDIAWYYVNHPSWIVFQNDQVTPAIDFQYSGYYYVSLDIQNPAVRAFILARCLAQKALGFNVIALDNVAFRNYGDSGSKRAGIWSGASFDASGNRTGGTWVQQYNGTTVTDVAVQNAAIEWLSWLRKNLNDNGMSLLGNVDVPVIGGVISASDGVVTKRMLAHVDMWLLERYFLSSTLGRFITDASWAVLYDVITDYNSHGGTTIFAMDYAEASIDLVPAADEAWAVANFLLMRGPSTFLAVGPYGYFITYPASWNPAVGHAVEAPHAAGAVYQRRYSTGFVVVNPSSTDSASYTVPTGTWADQFGNVVAQGAQSLAAKSGIVLVGG